MAILRIEHKCSKWFAAIPHKILINNKLIGVMQTPFVNIEIPEGDFYITVQSMIPFLSASEYVTIQSNVENVFVYTDREKWWDILFSIDLIFWLTSIFYTLPHPWNIVYKVITNGYFIFWLIYEFCIRKKYFRIYTFTKVIHTEYVTSEE